MKDRADGQRAKARTMMGGDLASAAAQRKTMGTEMGAKPEAVPGRVAKGPADRYVRPGAPQVSQRMPVMLAKGGKVSVPRGRMAQAVSASSSAKKDVHKHERALHKGQPLTKLKDGGKVGCYAAGGAAKYRKNGIKLPTKKPIGGDPVY